MGETVTLQNHLAEMRSADEKFQAERDRRYTEVKNAEEKALKIKEEADKVALGLARDIQKYKDEKANELRSQIERERGSYATQADLKAVVEKFETALSPLRDYATAQQGQQTGKDITMGKIYGAIAAATAIIGAIAYFS